MTVEEILHGLFHAILPVLAEHVELTLTAVGSAIGAWMLRARKQRRLVEAAHDEVECEAEKDRERGQEPAEILRDIRVRTRVRERANVLIRPGDKRLEKLLGRAKKKRKKVPAP